MGGKHKAESRRPKFPEDYKQAINFKYDRSAANKPALLIIAANRNKTQAYNKT
jgi:hypothetical protein